MFVIQTGTEYLNDTFDNRGDALEFFMAIKDNYRDMSLIEREKIPQKKNEFIIAKWSRNDYSTALRIREKLPQETTFKNYLNKDIKSGDVVYWNRNAKTIGKIIYLWCEASTYSSSRQYSTVTLKPNITTYNYAILKFINGRVSTAQDVRYLYLYEDYIKDLGNNIEEHRHKLELAEKIKI